MQGELGDGYESSIVKVSNKMYFNTPIEKIFANGMSSGRAVRCLKQILLLGKGRFSSKDDHQHSKKPVGKVLKDTKPDLKCDYVGP